MYYDVVTADLHNSPRLVVLYWHNSHLDCGRS